MRFHVMLALLAVLAPWLAACDRGPSDAAPGDHADSSDGNESVVVYVSADDAYARPILESFEDETGIRVRAVYDTEATKTTGLANRLRSERARPRADVFWSSENFVTAQLADEGVLTSIPSDVPRPGDGSWSDPAGRWIGFAARARVVVFAPGRIGASELPESWWSLAEPVYRDRVAMADPRFGTTRGHLGVLATIDDPARFDDWIAGLARNRVRVLTSGNAGVVQAVINGEVDFGMTDTDDVFAARDLGHDLAFVAPRHRSTAEPGGGTLLVPNTVGLVAEGPNRAAAERLVEWLGSPRVESMLLESPSRNLPIDASLEERARERGIEADDALRFDSVEAVGAMNDAVSRFLRTIDEERGEGS